MSPGRSANKIKGGLRPPADAFHAQISSAVRTNDHHHQVKHLEQQMLKTAQYEATDCVHIEHTPSGLPNCHEVPPRAAAMSPYRIGLCLTTLGWSERELARRTGRHQTEVRRWILGTAMIDLNVAEWLTELEQFLRDHPAPRLRPMLRAAIGERHQDQHGRKRTNQAEHAHSAVT